jgi:hypothetical protein
MLRLLEIYIDNTFDIDWTAGNEPIVTRPLIEIAEQMGRSERQIRNIERALVSLGLLVWRDSGNHHRKGRRDHVTHRLIYGYGPSLAPLGRRAADIITLAKQIRNDREQKRRCRIAISALRRRAEAAIGLIAAQHTNGARPERQIAALETIPKRHAAGTATETLIATRDRLAEIVSELEEWSSNAMIPEIAGKAEVSPATYYKIPKKESINGVCRAMNKEPAAKTDSIDGQRKHLNNKRDITYNTIIKAAGPWLSTEIKQRCNHRQNWYELIDIAASQAILYGINHEKWQDACRSMGRPGAAMAIVLLERATDAQRPGDVATVRSPSAYFQALINRANTGTLRLDRSIRWLAQNPHPSSTLLGNRPPASKVSEQSAQIPRRPCNSPLNRPNAPQIREISAPTRIDSRSICQYG